MMDPVIQSILNDHTPPLEPEIKEYLGSMLEDIHLQDGNDDEIETAQSTLQQFLAQEEYEAIVEALPRNAVSLRTTDTTESGPKSVTRLSTPNTSPIQSTKFDAEDKDKASLRSHKRLRKERRDTKRQTKTVSSNESAGTSSTSELEDDHTSAWEERLHEGKLWGGRGAGGRGLRITGENLANIHLPSISMHFQGDDLLVDSPMDIVRRHRYGLLGRNGVGKSTLLRHLAAHRIPGMPHNMRVLLVSQQIQGRDDQTTMEALVEADSDRTSLLEEQDRVEAEIEQGVNLEENAQRLGNIIGELDGLDADGAEDRALNILKGLSFTKAMINGPTSNLSGGWRMRLALAQALFVPQLDLILIDEASNHLDLHGMNWLIQYLTSEGKQQDRALIIVSHDRSFLDAICTDIIVMEHQRLGYHVGNYSEYQRQMQDKAAREAQILDATERQKSKAMAFVQKHQNGKTSKDPNKQRQAKTIKDKKMDRIGNYREDGKRWQQFSLKKMDMNSARLAKKVHIERDEPVLKLHFPDPTWPPGISVGSPLVQLDDVSFGYDPEGSALLQNAAISISRGSKIALVGNNGSGKTTLIKLINGELDEEGKRTGKLWRHPNLRMGHVTQYSVEELEEFAHMTVVEFAEAKLAAGRASSTVIKDASGNVRQYLGAFGLGGSHAYRPIGKLSGGERMRLCFAAVLADQPHILFLDESTNHVDLETLDSLATALNTYQGAVLMVSHNQAFLSGVCKELWVLERGHVNVNHDDTESFDDLFTQYRSRIMSSTAASDRSQGRRVKTTMAKRAATQGAGTKQKATLLG